MTQKVAVVGAGVIGCSVALRLNESLGKNVEITVISELFSPHTTSDSSGAIMIPFDVTTDNVRDDNIERWIRASFKFLKELCISEEAGLIDIQLVNGYYSEEANDESTPFPWWSDLTVGFRQVGDEEKSQMNIPDCFKVVYAFSTYIINCRKYLPWMMARIKQQGGTFVQRRIEDLSELSSYDIVINCTGLGSHDLIGDHSLYPVHGDAVLKQAPWVKQFMLLIGRDNYTYIFPRSNDVLLGGTGRKDDWSESPDKDSVEALKSRCASLIPSLAHAKTLLTWAGLRPARNVIRLEKDKVQTNNPLVIHCYGHGGQGVLLSRGCALDVTELVKNHLEQRSLMKPKL